MYRSITCKIAQQLSFVQKQQQRVFKLQNRVINTNAETTEQTNSKQSHQLPVYTPAERAKILQLLNSTSQEEFSQYEISKARVRKLLTWRMQHGIIHNLEDIFLVEGFARKTVQKFFGSLLKPQVVKTRAHARSVASFITPSTDVEHLQQLRSCVSLRVGVANVSFARLELDGDLCVLTHWQHCDVAPKKLHLHELVQRCLCVHELLPQADCYLFENPQMAQTSNNPGNADQQNVNIQRAQVTAMLSYALAARAQHATGQQEAIAPSVFYLRRFLTARLFSTLIGTERVSSENAVLHLMRTHCTEELINEPLEGGHQQHTSLRGMVQFPADLRQKFAQAERAQREFLGQALLLNLAFVRLVLLQDAQSISAVSPGTTQTHKTINENE